MCWNQYMCRKYKVLRSWHLCRKCRNSLIFLISPLCHRQKSFQTIAHAQPLQNICQIFWTIPSGVAVSTCHSNCFTHAELYPDSMFNLYPAVSVSSMCIQIQNYCPSPALSRFRVQSVSSSIQLYLYPVVSVSSMCTQLYPDSKPSPIPVVSREWDVCCFRF
jgi:hypothetical protein